MVTVRETSKTIYLYLSQDILYAKFLSKKKLGEKKVMGPVRNFWDILYKYYLDTIIPSHLISRLHKSTYLIKMIETDKLRVINNYIKYL